jgi:hypothetical protein
MTTKLTAAHRELLARVVPLKFQRNAVYQVVDSRGLGVAAIPMIARTGQECDTLAEAVAITVNESDHAHECASALRAECRRLETALRMACDDVVSDFQDPGGKRAEARARDYLEAVDKRTDYQGLIDMRERLMEGAGNV